MRKRYSLVVAIAMLAAAGTALAESPWAGTWKMDPSQSKLTGDTIRFASGADGEMSYTSGGHTTKFKLDGNPVKTWSGDEVSWKKLDDNTYESHTTANGVDVGTDTWTIAPDGKSLKIEGKGTRPDGKSFDDTSEYTRVGGAEGHGLAGSWKSTKASINEEQTYEIAEKGPDELSWNIPAIKGVLDAKLDGKDYAPKGPTVPKGLTISLVRSSPHTLKLVEKMNGEPVYHSTMTLSADGKKFTEVGSPAKTNEPVTEVWIKQ
jgi:hypothetical protein